MKITLKDVSKSDAAAILRRAYEKDRSAVYGPGHTVYGTLVTVQYDNDARLVEVQSNALSRDSLREYLPQQFG